MPARALLALALLCEVEPPPALVSTGKPLRWLRDERDRYVSRQADDPRQVLLPVIAVAAVGEWREQARDYLAATLRAYEVKVDAAARKRMAAAS